MQKTEHTRFLPRKTPVQRRSKAMVEAILDASARVLVEVGYDHSTTNVIAERAGVGIGSLYEYFPGKEAIFAALMRRLNAQMFTMMMSYIGDLNGLTAAKRIERVVEARVKSVLIDTKLYAALKDQIPHAVTVDQTDHFIEEFQAVSVAFLNSFAPDVGSRPAGLVADVAMRTMYAVVEDLAIHDPKKLRDEGYIDELKFLMFRYILSD